MKKGFTLIEMLVVVFIIALLASIILVSVNRARQDARDGKRRADLAAIKTAVELYYDRNGTYIITTNTDPTNQTGAQSKPSNGWFNCAGDCAGVAYFSDSIAAGLESWNFLNPAPSDPMGKDFNNGAYQYRYGTNVTVDPLGNPPGTKYSIFTRLENPNYPSTCNLSDISTRDNCWDTNSSKGSTQYLDNFTVFKMNYRVGNGF